MAPNAGNAKPLNTSLAIGRTSSGAAKRLEAAVRGTRIEDLDMAKAVSEMTRNRIWEGLAIGSQRLAEGNRGRILDLLG